MKVDSVEYNKALQAIRDYNEQMREKSNPDTEAFLEYFLGRYSPDALSGGKSIIIPLDYSQIDIMWLDRRIQEVCDKGKL